ncbi:MAG: shikimate kinase [Bacteroidales bacterium]|jgi:shikimate kinase|nr:shikimate kinase [Bacteroidales bacterium]
MNSNRKIFLIGYPGSGKSTYAKKIANYFNLPCLDTDKIIAQKLNLSISEIFNIYGEEYFRKCESEVLKYSIDEFEGFVMATGGGLACNENNIKTMLDNGIVVYVKASPEVLYNRIKNSKTIRPNHANDENLFEKINKELVERERFYQQAKYIVDSKRGCEKEIIYFCNQNKTLK